MNDSARTPVQDTKTVPLAKIALEEAAQPRAGMRPTVVRDYAAAMKEQASAGGVRFPPVLLFTDGTDYWLGDGFHRVLAAQQAGLEQIAAEVRPGTRRDAVLFGIGANTDHGLPRTNADKRKAVSLMLADAEWSGWNDHEIARHCQVSHTMVQQLRRKVAPGGSPLLTRKVRRGASVYELHVSPQAAARAPSPAPAALTTPALTTPAVDQVGVAVPDARAQVFAELGAYRQAYALCEQLTKLVDHLAKSDAGALYRQKLLRTGTQDQPAFACTALREVRAKLTAAEPYCAYCPQCWRPHPARPDPRCKHCGGRGWTTQAAFERSDPGIREQIMKMRPGV